MSAVVEAREPSARYLEAVQPALVRQFGLLATAPGGIARLRELILTLAVQGKLEPQCASEAPASEILSRAQAAVREQRHQRRKRTSHEIEPVEPDEYFTALPRGWSWCRGADLFCVVRGVTYQKSDASDTPREAYLPILRANNIRATINLDDLVYVPKLVVCDEQLLRRGDFLVCLASGSKNLVGKAAVFAGDAVCSFGAFCGVIRLAVSLPFFSVYLTSPLYRDAVSAASSGIGINNLKSSTLLDLPIAIPPEAEQARIVARVDELMRLCDALEAKGRLEAEQHASLLGTLMGTLIDSSTPEELAANWHRVAAHFDLLLDRPEAVDALEQSILQLAVRGLLVPQDPSEENAAILLHRLCMDKERLIGEGKLKPERPLPEIPENEKVFALPSGWVWARWGDIALKIGDIDHKMPAEVSEGVPYVSPRDFFGVNDIDFDGAKKIARSDFLELSRKIQPVDGDLIYPRYGTIGNVRLVEDHRDFLASYSCAVIKVYHGFVDPRFQYFLSISDIVRNQAAAATNKTTQPNVGLKSIQQYVIPLPPQAEQVRIVARIDELFRLCAALRQRLTASQTTQSHLAEALVDEVA